MVVHALHVAPAPPTGGAEDAVDTPGQEPLVGFVVSKAVGSAVCRNRVRRRLRHLSRPHLTGLNAGTLVVVRALPPAASAGRELSTDLAAAWASAIAKLERR